VDAFRLDNRVAFITGAGSDRGIGQAIGSIFASAGARVGLVDVDLDGARRNAERLNAEHPSAAFATAVEVNDVESVARAVAAVEASLGPIDILVNSAGITRGTPLWESNLHEFDEIMNVNVRGGFICLQAVLPGMMQRRYGRIIWLSSIAGKQGGGVFGSAAYAASKAAVIGLCQAAARQLGPYGVTSNAIAPGLVNTGLVGRTGGQAIEAMLRERTMESVPLRRVAEPEDIANAALFLASDAASYITGEIVDVNGGAYFD
jgi:2-hydroxycyclohexanecarboxyl-CoA dehydrogenase